MRLTLDSNDLYIYTLTNGQIIVTRHENPSPDDSVFIFPPVHQYVKIINVDVDELEVFGTVISGSKLKELAVELNKPRQYLFVNRQGYMHLCVIGEYTYYRINDLFGWSKYGVVLPSNTNLWNRFELDSKKALVNLLQIDKSLEDCTSRLVRVEKELSLCNQLAEQKEKECSNLGKHLKEKEKECSELQKHLVEKEQDCRRISDELLANKKKVTAVKIATRSLISYLRDLHQSLHEELGTDFPLPKFGNETDQISLTSLEGGSNSTLISEAHIDILEN